MPENIITTTTWATEGTTPLTATELQQRILGIAIPTGPMRPTRRGPRDRDAPEQETTRLNPSNLLPDFRSAWGPTPISPRDARAHWGRNPFIIDSEEWVAYNELDRIEREGVIHRFLKLPDVPIVRMPSKRRLSQPILKFTFDSLGDARLRLCNGGVFVGSNMFLVRDIYDAENDYLLRLTDGKTEYKAWYYKTPEIDLRSPEPQYLTFDTGPAYLLRPPYKQQRQSVGYDNLLIKAPGATQLHRCDTMAVMKGLTRDVLSWNSQLLELMKHHRAFKSLRLSKDISVYRNSDDQLYAEYRGRNLGAVNENTITVDEQDYVRPWIRRDVSAVDCTLRRE